MSVKVLIKRFDRYDWSGLSTDTKPTAGGFGSTFYEEDTGARFIYTASGWAPDFLCEIGKYRTLITVTPSIAAAAFSANDVVGGKLTLANAVRLLGGKGVLNTLMLVDKSKQEAALSLFIFGADLAGTYADNSPEAVTATDWLKCQAVVDVSAADYKTMANASVVAFGGIEMGIKATTGRTLYGLMVTTGTPTYGANAIQLTLGFEG